MLNDGRSIDLATGYMPLLVNFTVEDHAAKGLRKRGPESVIEPSIHFTAFELVRDHKLLLLRGASGTGKTTFAKYLCYRLTTLPPSYMTKAVRNELGHVREEKWDHQNVTPWLHTVGSRKHLEDITSSISELLESRQKQEQEREGILLLVIDAVECAGEDASDVLNKMLTLAEARSDVKLLLLCDNEMSENWHLPPSLTRHNLLPLLQIQRRRAVATFVKGRDSDVQVGIGAAAATPAIFAMALRAGHVGDQTESVLDAWLTAIAPTSTEADMHAKKAFEQIRALVSDDSKPRSRLPSENTIHLGSSSPFLIKYLLAARHLTCLPEESAIGLHRLAPALCRPILRSLLQRLGESPKALNLMNEIIRGPSVSAQLGALLISELDFIKSADIQSRIVDLTLKIADEGVLSPLLRYEAGRVLSRLHDPRDLQALATIPGGTFSMGSETHVNSQPVHKVFVHDFRCGVYCVVNKHYLEFVEETARTWSSSDGRASDKKNVPATDLTWYDANAYCKWLTTRWRACGKISAGEKVRLPTEVEWERAAGGGWHFQSSGLPVYPWGSLWVADASNYEHTGLNMPCAVGIFPKNRSPHGCFDMAGQVWEWCSTLWGEQMTHPTYQYPWKQDDGREAAEAPESMRRVLRGGCFSSSALKVSCSYRGSLEPAGFWRGNGFRIVVGRVE
ncbi:hypothetical protein ACN47E_008125 [Coniothyrium glycines]